MKSRALVPLLLLLSLASCEKFEWKRSKSPSPSESTGEEHKPATVPWDGQAIAADTFIKIAKRADPAVVNIGTTKIIKRRRHPFVGPNGGSPFEDFFGDDLFRHFFGDQPPGDMPDLKQQSLGSGFVYSEDGFLVTNNHVIEKADEITVTIGKEDEYKAKVVGADPKTDLALIKIEPKDKLTTLPFGDSDELQVGEIVLAIGNPFGLSHTVTQGIVSAKERSIEMGPYDAFIQTDASINPGNSGGPLVNLRAEVVGINAAIVASGQGIGFAIPINLAKTIIAQLRATGSVTRGWLGVYIQKVDPELALSLGLKDRKGALVSSVQQGSPAEKVGIRRGDVIVKFDGHEIEDFNELPRRVASTPVGKKVRVEVFRNGGRKTFDPTLGKLPASEGTPEAGEGSEESEEPGEVDKVGVSVVTLNERLAGRLGLDRTVKGVMVTSVRPGSAAAEKGLRENDVIIEINKKPVPDVQAYRAVTKSLSKGQTVLLLVKRGAEATLFVAFTL